MTDNLVTVTATWTDGSGNFANGNYAFTAQGTLMDSPSVAIVTPVALGQLVNGSLAVPLLASDNFTLGYLTWHVLLRVAGFPTVDVPDIQINFALGATQGLFGILEASGWSATTT